MQEAAEVTQFLVMVFPCAEMSQLLRISIGRRGATAVEAAVMRYLRGSHHPVSQPQGRWSLVGGAWWVECGGRGGGCWTALIWVPLGALMVNLREVGKCMSRQPRQSDTLNLQGHPLRGFHCHHSSSTLPLHHIFFVCSVTIEERRKEARSSRKKGRTDSSRPLLNGSESRGPSERYVGAVTSILRIY